MRRDQRRLMAMLAFGGAILATQAWAQTTNLTVEILSSRPELVSGGDALVRIDGGVGAPKVMLGTTDVSGVFKLDRNGGWTGLVTGLKDGPNQLVATASGKEAKLTLVNHPLNGT